MQTVFVIEVENLKTGSVKREAIAGSERRAHDYIEMLRGCIGFAISHEHVEIVDNKIKYTDLKLGMMIILSQEEVI